MSKYNSAGQYTERLSGGFKPSGSGISTSTLVVPGFYPDGPDEGTPPVVTSWAEFERMYGGLNTKSENGYAIKGFFDNGGSRVIPLRITTAASVKASSSQLADWKVEALYKGAKYNGYKVDLVDNGTNYNITVSDAADNVLEFYEAVSFAAADADKKNYVLNMVNKASNVIAFSADEGEGDLDEATATLSGGADETSISGLLTSTALSALDAVVDDNLLLVAPDYLDTDNVSDLITYAEGRKDAFVIYTPTLSDKTVDAAITYKDSVSSLTSKAACYFGHVNVLDPLRGKVRMVSAVGHIAGCFARTHRDKNPGKNPAGIVDGQLRGIVSVALPLSEGDRDKLYVKRINPIVSDSAHGMCIWGCRTTAGDPEWMYINHELLFQFHEKAVKNATLWVNFENNTAATRLRVQSQLSAMLLNYHNQGYYAGSTPAESFYVICDETNNPPEVTGNGELVVDYGIAPGKPAEFVIHRLRQKTQ